MARAAKPKKIRHVTSPPVAPVSNRIHSVDAARGFAVVLMVAYHLCFDLNYFQLVKFDFYHSPFWLTARAMIVTLFLLLVGISLHLATTNNLKLVPYLRRLVLLAVCAVLVSTSSYALFPASGIFFGVLHFIVLASLLGLLFTRFYTVNLITGMAWITAGLLLHHSWFDQPWANWIGFMTHKPVTEDYVPLFPWFGVVLLGLYLGKTLSRRRGWKKPGNRPPGSPFTRLLNWAGKHSLAIYMLHQPVLLGILFLSSRLKG